MVINEKFCNYNSPRLAFSLENLKKSFSATLGHLNVIDITSKNLAFSLRHTLVIREDPIRPQDVPTTQLRLLYNYRGQFYEEIYF